jgi:hypothetical protein
MSEQVQKFDPSTLMQGVKDRIKSTFVSLIPDDQWDGMVQKEIDNFFTYKKEAYSGYGSNKQYEPTEFAKLVDGLLKEEALERIKTYLKGDEFYKTWTEKAEPTLADAIKALILENSGQMLINLLQAPMQMSIQNLQSQITYIQNNNGHR